MSRLQRLCWGALFFGALFLLGASRCHAVDLSPLPPPPPVKRVKLASPKATEFKASLGVKMTTTAAVLPPPYQSAAWWGGGTETIVVDGDRHAFVYADWSPAVWAYVWEGQAPGRAYKLPEWTQLQCPTVVLKGNELTVADMLTANGGVRISTFWLGSTNALLEQNLAYSDVATLCPSACLTPAGGVLVAAYQHDSSYNLLTFYRSPAGEWQGPSYREFIPPPVGISSIAIEMIAGPDNRVWCVINRDSSHVIDLARYDEWQFYDFHQALLNAETVGGVNVQGEMAPNGEFPNVTLCRSGTNVLLSYQNYRQEWPCEFLYSWNVVTALGADLVPHFVALNSNLVMEVFTPSPIFATASGFDLLSYELNPDCSQGPWRHRRFSGGNWIEPGVNYNSQLPQGALWSPDGWTFWRDENFVPRLTKIPLTEVGERLTITKTGGVATVSWPHPGWTLQRSADLSTWTDVGTTSPYSEPIAGKAFFRLRQ